jgi:hypothetical protein
MRRPLSSPFVPVAALLLAAGCAPAGPYPLTMSFTQKATGQALIKSFKVTGGGEPVEQKGTLGAGENCIVAGQSSGSRTAQVLFESQLQASVVGESTLSQPLVPGDDEASEVGVSVLRESVRTAQSASTLEVFVDPAADPVQRTDQTYADGDVLTRAGFYGVAMDEYYVRIGLDDVWDDLAEMPAADVTLLTRAAPEPGEVWPSFNGNSLFRYVGPEEITVAGRSFEADKVEVYATGAASPDGAGVYGQCLQFGLSQSTSDAPGSTPVNDQLVALDAGCTGDFQHVLAGTQWWWNGVLLKEETSATFVTITEYGFEWYTLADDGLSCTRTVDTVKGSPSAVAFVQYEVRLADVAMAVTKLTE